MTAPLRLPRIAWGDPSAPRRALLVHGLGSSGALMWRLGDALAAAGWHATAIDLRGHGDAPRSLDYTVAAYAADLVATLPDDGGGWDAVVGHSLGGAAATVAAASDPEWTRRLILVDPAIHVSGRDASIIRRSQERAFADTRIEVVQQEHPHWHPQDHELKVDAVRRASAWAVEQTSVQNQPWDVRADAARLAVPTHVIAARRRHAHPSVQNQPWDVRADAARLAVPTHVIAADPEVYSIFTGDLAAEVRAANPRITMSVVADAGHSLHRDKPEESIRQLLEALK